LLLEVSTNPYSSNTNAATNSSKNSHITIWSQNHAITNDYANTVGDIKKQDDNPFKDNSIRQNIPPLNTYVKHVIKPWTWH